MPVLPVAPGEFTTGKETLRSSSMSLAAFRASWSAPPPGPQGTMNSIGRDGYFSCAETDHESETSSSAVAARKVHLIEGATYMGISSGSSVDVEALFSRAYGSNSQQQFTLRLATLDIAVRLRGLLQRKLAVDCHLEPAGRMGGEQVGGAAAELLRRLQVVRKVRPREKHRSRFAKLQWIDRFHQSGSATIVDAQTTLLQTADAAGDGVLAYRIINNIDAFTRRYLHHFFPEVGVPIADDMIGAALFGDVGFFRAACGGEHRCAA